MACSDDGSDIFALKNLSCKSSLPQKAASQIMAALDIISLSYRQEKYLNHPKSNEKARQRFGTQDLKELNGNVTV